MGTLLEVERLSKRFGAIIVADGVAFSLDRGQCLGVIGPNGAGKSSLFNLILGVVAPDAGSIRLDGREIVGARPHQRARLGIARAFQIPQPFPHLSIYENVLAAASYAGGLHGGEAEGWAMDVLDRVHLAGKANAIAGAVPLLDRKRLEFAKAIASRPKLLLLDEIAAGLTEPEVEELTASIIAAKADHAIIWIEHIPHALKAAADRIMVLHFGRKLLEGAPGEVMESRIVREIYMGLSADDIA
jgi:branched-chain amino acid transport system ATP-binding protein